LTAAFSEGARAIFAKQVLLHVATLGTEGEPHVTPVWCALDGDDIVINTALGRKKARNLASDARVAFSLTDPDDPYICVAGRGTVVTFTTEGADEVINSLAQKYLGVETYPYGHEGDVRVTVRIRPDHVSVQPH